MGKRPRDVPVTRQDADTVRALGDARQVLDRSVDPDDGLTRAGATTKIKESVGEYHARQYLQRVYGEELGQEVSLPKRGSRRGRGAKGPPILDLAFELRDGTPLVIEVKYGQSKLGRTSSERFEASETGEITRRVTPRGTEQFSPDWFRARLNELAAKGGRSTILANRMREHWEQGRIQALVLRVDQAGNVQAESRTEHWRQAGFLRKPSGSPAAPTSGRTAGPTTPVPERRKTAGQPAPDSALEGKSASGRLPRKESPQSPGPTSPAQGGKATPLPATSGAIGAGLGLAANLVHSAMRTIGARQEADKADRAFKVKLRDVDTYRQQGQWVGLRLVIEKPIRTDLTGFDSRLKFVCWQLSYARSEAEVRGRQTPTIRAAPSRAEMPRGDPPCRPSRADWELHSFDPITFPPRELSDPTGPLPSGVYAPVLVDFNGREPEEARLRELRVTRLKREGPPRLRLVDLRTGRPLETQVLQSNLMSITVFIAKEHGKRLSASTFTSFKSDSNIVLISEIYRELPAPNRSGLVLWKSVPGGG